MDPSKNLYTNLGVGNNNRFQQNFNNMNDSMGSMNLSNQTPNNNSYSSINRFSNQK